IRGIALSRSASENLPNGLLFERLESVNALTVCIRAMEEHGMTGRVRMLIAARANQVQALERCIERHFKLNPGSGASFGVYASGFESFSGEDLLLYNKGIKPLDCFRALNIFRGLKERFPDNFSYSGITFILFTPWTTLENLHLNLGLIRFLGMTRKEAGNAFQSRIRLHPLLSITALAERENLIADRETDPVLIMNRRKLFGSERAWKFKDERLRPVSRVVLRYDLLESGIKDRLLGKIKSSFDDAGFDWKTGDGDNLLGFTLCMIDAIRRGKETPGEEALIEQSLLLWKTRCSQSKTVRQNDRLRTLGKERVGLSQLAEKLSRLAKKGHKPVFSIEDVLETEYSNGISDLLKGMGLKGALIDRQTAGAESFIRFPRKGVLYASPEEDKLRRMIEL
ncbi:MAG: hypothetical protein FJ088_15270, partial [Deltaproteobacteria bacterium]|nr:hypothetical protein [Deltaproteobacteria bacterium]